MPPTVEDVKNFVNDSSPKAYENLVNKLLATPQYGERMAWDWLDVARAIDRAARVMVQHALMEAAVASKDQDLEWVNLAKKAALSDAPDVVLRILLSKIDHPFGESKPDPDAPIRSLLEHPKPSATRRNTYRRRT